VVMERSLAHPLLSRMNSPLKVSLSPLFNPATAFASLLPPVCWSA
jgi:hypothetical protein